MKGLEELWICMCVRDRERKRDYVCGYHFASQGNLPSNSPCLGIADNIFGGN